MTTIRIDWKRKEKSVSKLGLQPEKVILFVWWDIKILVYHTVLDQNEASNARYCQLEAWTKTCVARTLIIQNLILLESLNKKLWH